MLYLQHFPYKSKFLSYTLLKYILMTLQVISRFQIVMIKIQEKIKVI